MAENSVWPFLLINNDGNTACSCSFIYVIELNSFAKRQIQITINMDLHNNATE